MREKITNFLQVTLLVLVVTVMGMGFVSPAAGEEAGNCQTDCGCNLGELGCCVLPNGAKCLAHVVET